MKKIPDKEIEDNLKKQGFNLIAGVDEAGRGPLAGPVVASAVLLNESFAFDCKINDSKKMSAKQREKAFLEIQNQSKFGVGIVGVEAIDSINIFRAACRAMEQAIDSLMLEHYKNICFVVDGNVKLEVADCAYKSIPRSDTTCISVACASIVAKVIRDRLMSHVDRIVPQYEFCRHKGYGTKLHFEKIKEFGPSIFHRKSFHPINKYYK